MKLTLTNENVKAMKATGCTNPAILDHVEHSWRDAVIDTKFLSPQDFAMLKEALKPEENNADKKLLRKLNAIAKARQADDKPTINLVQMTDLLTERVRALPNTRVYRDDGGGNLLPYFVAHIEYHERYQDTPAHITIDMWAHKRGRRQKRSETVWRSDLKNGVTVDELLLNKGWLLETDELNENHQKEIERYQQYVPLTGRQFAAFGRVDLLDGNWRRSEQQLGTRDDFSKIIMDDLEDREKEEGTVVSSSFWTQELEDEKEEKDVITLPTHPYLHAFNLRTHDFITIHVAQVTPYRFDPNIADKLVLSEQKRWMISTLVNTINEEGGDIIRGKSGGIIVLSSGAPGTGKTLTAEVFAEASKKALYVVQCSQLGIDSESLEKELSTVLERAQRWQCVLLIDEADVYIHERGSNMNQNAVVGVFLRLLEYYSGILFLTTNRETIVDDAIMSRVTAHVHYALPTADERFDLWKLMASQYNLALSKELIAALVDEFKVSGRTIMKLVRLAKVISTKRGQKLTLDVFKEAVLFQKTEHAAEAK